MAARTVTINITGTSRQLQAALKEAGLTAEVESKSIGDSVDGAATRAGGGFAKLGSIIQNVTGIPVGEAFKKSGDKMAEADTKGQGLSKTLGNLGGAVALAGVVGFAAVAGESVNLAQKFQGTVTSIAANADIPVAAAQKIGNAFLSTAGTTIYSGQQIGQAYAGVAGQLGQTEGHALTAKQAMQVMSQSMDLAEASGQDLGSTTSSLSGLMQVYGAKANDAATFTDVLFNASRMTGTSVSGVAGTFTKLHATLGVVTPSIGQLGGMLVDLTSHGETGRKALAAINSTMNGMLSPAAAATKAQQDLGLTTYDSTGHFVGFGSIISQLQPKLAGMTQEQQLATLKSIGLSSANKAMLSTILAGPEAFDKATAAASRAGSAHEGAAKQAQTLGHQMETMKATAEDLGTKFGQVLIPKLETLMHVISEVVTWFMKHKDAAIALGIVVGAILATMLIMWVVNTIAAMAFWTAATGGIIILVAALAVGIAWIIDHWTEVWGKMKAIVAEVWHFIYGNFIGPIMHAFEDVVNFIKQHWELLVEILMGPIGIVLALWNAFHTQIMGFFDAIGKKAGQVIDGVVNFFTAMPGRIVSGLGDIVGTIWGGLVHVGDWLETHVFQPMHTWFAGLPGRLASAVGDIVGQVFGGLTSAWNWINSNVFAPIVSGFEGLPNDLANGVMSALGALSSIGKAILNPIIRSIDTAIDHINSATSGIPLIGSSLHIPDIPTLAVGGPIPGSVGQPVPMIGHGGEYVLSRDMVLGNDTSWMRAVPGAAAAAAGQGGGQHNEVHVHASTNADPTQIAAEVGWKLRMM